MGHPHLTANFLERGPFKTNLQDILHFQLEPNYSTTKKVVPLREKMLFGKGFQFRTSLGAVKGKSKEHHSCWLFYMSYFETTPCNLLHSKKYLSKNPRREIPSNLDCRRRRNAQLRETKVRRSVAASSSGGSLKESSLEMHINRKGLMNPG